MFTKFCYFASKMAFKLNKGHIARQKALGNLSLKKKSEETLRAFQGLPGFRSHLKTKVNLIFSTTCITVATEGNKGKKTEISQK